MESSRIESGTDISSDGERERECKTKMMQFGLQAGIQPLDIRLESNPLLKHSLECLSTQDQISWIPARGLIVSQLKLGNEL